MHRRDFLKESALYAVALGQALPQSAEAGAQRGSRLVLENEFLVWTLQAGAGGITSSGFQNKLSGRQFALQARHEFALVFSGSKHRLEIPWWHFRLGVDDAATGPEQEQGLEQGFHRPGISLQGWRPVNNLAGRGGGRIYSGYGWYRHSFELPEEADGEEIVFVLGGYDQQDWNDYWIYVNGAEAGQRTSEGRWREPGVFVFKPEDDLYSSLLFGGGRKNLLAVRTRRYDFRFGGLDGPLLERYVFRPFLFDQFISAGQPYRRLSEFVVDDVQQQGSEKLTVELRDPTELIRVSAHYELDGPVKRKWLEIRNEGSREQTLLDVVLEDFASEQQVSEGGHGEPVFLEDEIFCAVEHPAGVNQGQAGRVKLWHCPGRRLTPGAATRSHAALFGVGESGQALSSFHDYLRRRSPRREKMLSVYTPFGINNQWGGCPPLRDVETLDVLGVLEQWQQKGLHFDFFTIDSGWPDNNSDLKDFNPTCYPQGPGAIVKRVEALGMKFGLWFSTSWGGWSSGSYGPIQPSAIPEPGGSGEPPTEPPVGVYRNGYPISGGVGRQLCMASDPYFRVFRDAVVHHVSQNNVRLLKFDSGNYYCNSTAHGHLPGKYSVEAMYERLIEIADRARQAAPDVHVIWYWGLGSPFWALHGDLIFESGLFMEGSGTSWYPALYYRDSVTLSLDQSSQYAKLIPAVQKDTLGVWLSQIRWANFMGKERWREALIMDLARGSLVFPQLWGDPYLLNGGDVAFLAEFMSLARSNESVFRRPRIFIGDSWQNEPYGYSFFEGAHGFVFLNNMHFSSRQVALPLGASLGLDATPGSPLEIVSHFPERADVRLENGRALRSGDSLELWVRPFEVLMLEVRPAGQTPSALPKRDISAQSAAAMGAALDLGQTPYAPWMDLRFADAARFEKDGKKLAVETRAANLPDLGQDRHFLAIAVRLAKSGAEWRYFPAVAEIVQLRAQIAGHNIQLMPVPDARQFGNTQSAGCSWVVYKVPLSDKHSSQRLEFAVHAYLPEGVKSRIEAWVVSQWWEESTRPQADGLYGDAPL